MRISFLGAGNMAGAIIHSMIDSGRAKPKDITVFDIVKSKYETYASMGVVTADSMKRAFESSDYIFLAVKPQDYSGLLAEISGECQSCGEKVYISIAAAVPTDYICRMLGGECPVVRAMPNTPLLIGCGATALSRNDSVTDKDFTKICGIFASSGTVTVLKEDQMEAVISVNSSSPAYVYLLANAMIEGAREQGIPEKTSRELVYWTIRGSAEMLLQTEAEPAELIRAVASPGGTTLAALRSFEQDRFEETVKNAMQACTQRALELKKQF